MRIARKEEGNSLDDYDGGGRPIFQGLPQGELTLFFASHKWPFMFNIFWGRPSSSHGTGSRRSPLKGGTYGLPQLGRIRGRLLLSFKVTCYTCLRRAASRTLLFPLGLLPDHSSQVLPHRGKPLVILQASKAPGWSIFSTGNSYPYLTFSWSYSKGGWESPRPRPCLSAFSP